ncbi:MAG TPA: helix-turn-helix domain-containing protein [Mycobacterium sp.]|nr:helix-turn-helix domain-containing protein [Mycobacterium sp.]
MLQQIAWRSHGPVPPKAEKWLLSWCFTLVGLLGDYSKHDAQRLRRLIERLAITPKRPVTSADTKIQPCRLDRRLSPDTIAELVAAYRTGTSTNELCRRHGISKGGVLKILAEHGVAMRHQPMTRDEIDQAVQLYVNEELSIRSIATKLGKSKGSVWKALHERDRRCFGGSRGTQVR